MIDKALELLRDELDAYLQLVLPGVGSGPRVELTKLMNQDGTLSMLDDKVGFTLISVDEEKIMKAQKPTVQTVGGTTKFLNPEIRLNLFVLFTANFDDYSTALRHLSQVITFFQGKTVYNKQVSPTLDPGIESLYIDYINETIEQQYELWTRLGAKYIPSVVYRVRMLTLQANNVLEERPDIITVNTQLQNSL